MDESRKIHETDIYGNFIGHAGNGRPKESQVKSGLDRGPYMKAIMPVGEANGVSQERTK